MDLLPIQEQIWNEKYRFVLKAKIGGAQEGDKCIEDTWWRVAHACAKAEATQNQKYWATRFYNILENFMFLPAGRIISGAGTGRNVTLFNCFVTNTIPDSMEGIFQRVKEGALTMQHGGGIGMDFSTLRPKGDLVKGVGSDASGPLSFMDVWDTMCKTIMSAGARRGAMMGCLRVDHPDIEGFIEAKMDSSRFRNFNLSVLVTDSFMHAVKTGGGHPLMFDGVTYRHVEARDLWDKIMKHTYNAAEPGVIFIDRINKNNNLKYCETICATNPCAEQPLPPNGACLLGSINLTQFINNPFRNEDSYLDMKKLREVTGTAIRLMDNVIDISKYPLKEQKNEALSKRRIGLGVTGLGSALAMRGIHYGCEEAPWYAQEWIKVIAETAYETSRRLAVEKGTFPAFNLDKFGFKDSKLWCRADGPLRNSHLLSIAPTGTISLLAGNISGGIEPMFAWEFDRKILNADGTHRTEHVEDYAVRLYRKMFPNMAQLPEYFHAKAHDLTPKQHIAMQAAVQPYIDTSISKTVNCPADISFEDFRDLYMHAYDEGLKCCATFRPNDITGSILSAVSEAKPTKKEAQKIVDEFIKAIPDNLMVEYPQTNGSLGPIDIGGGIVASSKHSGMAPDPSTIHISIEAQNTLLPREEELRGSTYKLKWPGSEHAYYITINDACFADHDISEAYHPYEIFINSKNMEHYAWTVALTRMISAVFRRNGGNVDFVAEELKAVFDPKGGAWMEGKYVPSLLAAIGNIVEKHLMRLKARHEGKPFPPMAELIKDGKATLYYGQGKIPMCPKCFSTNMALTKPNCPQCLDCGFSKCD